jgi:hypothetical protein
MGDPFLPTRPYAPRSPQGSPSIPIAPLIRREVRPIEADGFRPRAKRPEPTKRPDLADETVQNLGVITPSRSDGHVVRFEMRRNHPQVLDGL